ncbi:MAG: ERF family protein [Chloroflexota bacterium]
MKGETMNEITKPLPDASQSVTVRQDDSPLAISGGPGALLSAIVGMAKDPSVDADKLERLLAMQERMEARQAEAMFNEALHVAQQEMPRVAKNGTIKLGEGKGQIAFATFEDVDTALRPIMQRHGFSLSFDMQMKEGGGAVITGTLRHSAGHAKTASIPLALDSGPGRNNLQAMGSTFSYGRRYVTEMFFNIVRTGVDDDGKRGGTKFITEALADELREMARSVGRQEGQLLDTMFGGSIRSFEELEDGPAYLAVRNTLLGIQRAQQKKAQG